MADSPVFVLDFAGLSRVSAPIEAHPTAVLFSLVIAALASFVALDLSGRVRTLDVVSGRLWVVAGAAVLGTGIWSMHFIGMAAAELPFRPRVDGGITLWSWLLAIAAAALPVWLASLGAKRLRTWAWLGAAGTSLGVGAMHLVGMGAMKTAPGPIVHLGLLAVAALVSVLCTRLALGVFSGVRDRTAWRAFAAHAKAAVLMGGGLTALHYMAMAAASYAMDSICTTNGGHEIGSLGSTVGAVGLAFLALMLLVSWLERRSHRLALQLNRSLDLVQAELQFVTFNDATTGLPNRLVFQDRLSQAVELQARVGGKLAVVLVGFNQLDAQTRHLNDAEIDALMRDAAARLVSSAGRACAVSYAGNQQFLLLVSGTDVDADSAVALVHRIGDSLSLPCGSGDGALQLRASAGISLFPDDGPVDRLTSNAASALELTRGQSDAPFAFFESGMDGEAQLRAFQLAALRRAIPDRQLQLHYQPKIHASSGLVAGVEALMRWRHPDLGMVGPDVFIPLAERFGLIGELGGWVLEEACRQMAEWGARGIRMRVAINVSVLQLTQPDFVQQVTGTLERYGVDPRLMTCEITESGAMQDIDKTRQVFDALQLAGVQLSIDDFGTGYSSLSYLRRLPICQLKIDRSFVSDLDRDPDAEAIVASIIQMAHALRLEVVAEGVETTAQRDILLALQCDKFQGYLFARPMPAADLSASMALQAQSPQFRESIFAATA